MSTDSCGIADACGREGIGLVDALDEHDADKDVGDLLAVIGTSMVWLLPVSSMTFDSITPPRSRVTSALTGPVKGFGIRILAVSPGA